MEINKHDDMNRLIDASLPFYGDATPLAGLEQRVLNRIRLAENRLLTRAAHNGAGVLAANYRAATARERLPLRPAGRQGSRRLGVAFALATALVLVAVGVHMRPGNVPAPVKVARTVEAPPAEAPVMRQRPVRRGYRVRSLPKERQFPSPAPLSRDERTLLAYVRLLRQAGEDPPTLEDKPIEIATIQIQPLQSDGNQ